MSAAPTGRAGTTTLSVVGVSAPRKEAATPPINTWLAGWKPVPIIWITTSGAPALGVTLPTAGAGPVGVVSAAKPPATTICWPSGLTTLTSAGPPGKAGVTTLIVVEVG